MSITSTRDIAEAISSGRVHTQRFFKNSGLVGDNEWQDWSYTSGQPAYDARIGLSALTFSPYSAAGNDAIYLPPVAAGEERHVVGVTLTSIAGNVDQFGITAELYDLLGVYPLIDGDSTDQQTMDNSLTLPRYEDGVGVYAVLVNHVAPSITAGCLVGISYVSADGNSRSMQVYTLADGINKANSTLHSAGTSQGMLYLPSDGGGVKEITSLTFNTAPGGLWAIYLVKPINRISTQAGANGVNRAVFSEKCLCSTESFNLPRIYDGAWLGFFYMPSGTNERTVSLFGSITFLWK
jgi:hypothetical protein